MRTLTTSLVVFAVLAAAGCDSKSPPPSATSQTSRAPLGGLAETPTSLPGKSAAMGRDAVRAAAGAQDQAVNLANDIAGGSGGLSVGGLKFTPPSTWQNMQPPNRMQAAALRVDSDTVVAFFGNIGGDVASNVNRWKTQMTTSSGTPADAKISELTTADGIKITLVSMEGTYKGMTSGDDQPKPNTGFRGAIMPSGTTNVFIRLTGPIAKVNANDEAFKQMVLSATK